MILENISQSLKQELA